MTLFMKLIITDDDTDDYDYEIDDYWWWHLRMCEASIAALSNGFHGSSHQMEKLNWALGKIENDENV